MSLTGRAYPAFIASGMLQQPNTALNGASVMIQLVNQTFTDDATDVFLSDIPAGQRIAGRTAALTGVTVSQDPGGATHVRSGPVPSIPAVTGTVRGFVYYLNTGVESTSRLISRVIDSTNPVLADQPYNITHHADGFLRVERV